MSSAPCTAGHKPANATICMIYDDFNYFPHIAIVLCVLACVVYWAYYGVNVFVMLVNQNYKQDFPEWVAKEESLKDDFSKGSDKGASHRGTFKMVQKLRISFKKRESSGGRHMSISKVMFEPWNDKRVEGDAKALLARASPDEEEQREQLIDHAVAWLVLHWDIPTTVLLPFRARNVWPEKLRVPFHYAGNIFYLSPDVSFVTIRKVGLWISLMCLFAIELMRLASDGFFGPRWAQSKRLVRRKGTFSRIYFGALFTQVIYSAGALLGDFRNCKAGSFGGFDETPCTLARIENATMSGETFEIKQVPMDWSTVVLAVVTCFWAFRGAIKFTLYEQNSEANPTFVFMPAYEALRYTIKAVISGTGSLFRSYKKITMPIFLIGFAFMFVITYIYQPCMGPGRRANNLRATATPSAYGFHCAALSASCSTLKRQLRMTRTSS